MCFCIADFFRFHFDFIFRNYFYLIVWIKEVSLQKKQVLPKKQIMKTPEMYPKTSHSPKTSKSPGLKRAHTTSMVSHGDHKHPPTPAGSSLLHFLNPHIPSNASKGAIPVFQKKYMGYSLNNEEDGQKKQDLFTFLSKNDIVEDQFPQEKTEGKGTDVVVFSSQCIFGISLPAFCEVW